MDTHSNKYAASHWLFVKYPDPQRKSLKITKEVSAKGEEK